MSSRMPLRRGNWKVHFVLFVSLIFVTSVLLPVFARAENEDAKDLKLRDKRYYYKAFNRRDPFQSLIVGEFEESEIELIDVYSVRLVGVLTGGMERYAMLENDNGLGFIVKTGDPIRNGSIVSVGDRSLVARVSMFGQTTSVTLRMED
jgi:hypothetical protein